jgi:hypothetical protein
MADFATHQYGSDLSLIAAEYGSISACSTQNKAELANKIVFLLLIRDQEVEGSNPFAPTTFNFTNQRFTATSSDSRVGSIRSIELRAAGTLQPTPQRFATSLTNVSLAHLCAMLQRRVNWLELVGRRSVQFEILAQIRLPRGRGA